MSMRGERTIALVAARLTTSFHASNVPPSRPSLSSALERIIRGVSSLSTTHHVHPIST